MTAFVQLSDELFINNGYHRKVYFYPGQPDKCIKIPYTEVGKMTVKRELNYIQVLRNRKLDLHIMPEYFGTVETNRGTGYVYELIVNYDRTPAKCAGDFFRDSELLHQYFDRLVEGHCMVRDNLYQNQIVTMRLTPPNILMPEVSPGEYVFRVVSDIGSPVAIHLDYHVAYFARQKVTKRWNEYKKEILRLFPGEQMEKFSKLI